MQPLIIAPIDIGSARHGLSHSPAVAQGLGVIICVHFTRVLRRFWLALLAFFGIVGRMNGQSNPIV